MNRQVHVCAQMRFVGKALLIIVLHLYMIRRDSWCSSTTAPMKCTDTTRVCTSFLAFRPGPAQTMDIVQSMFDVLPQDITVEEGNVGGGGQVFAKKNCSCSTRTHEYLTNTTFTVRKNGSDGGSVRDIVAGAYGGLAVVPNTTRVARVGAVVSIQLLCGCSSGLWNYLMSYVMGEKDSVMTLASRFGVSMDSIESVNGLSGPENVTVGALYYIPLNQVPGAPYASDNNTANNAPAPAPLDYSLPAEEVNDKVHLPYGWILGGTGFALVLIVVAIVIWVSLRSSSSFAGTETKDDDGNNYHKFHILQKSLCCAPGRCTCCSPQDLKQTTGETNDNQTTIPKVIRTDVFEVEKPLVFTHEEVLLSTDGFSDSNLLGHGTYGSVYYGILRDQEVAIKRMTATKTKEFMAEMKVLCTVHHTNLVELIGYAASDDELFVIYEYAQKGSVRSHLRDPQNKGHTSLSWIMRVQIALDAARGLEYIHEHTKTHYVHRDINTSNILLDAAFRAKISDFGLAKLVGKTNEGEASVTRVVGTFGYLAPEYLSDGFATSKSDVYAFGVVLLEIISGRQAITHAKGAVSKNSDRRSLVSIMLPALRNTPDPTSMSRMKEYIDPYMMELCPHDCVFKLAMLAKQCLDDEPMLRPDMKQVVISLSQILLSSVEWEATLAGNSQVFSGLVQGR